MESSAFFIQDYATGSEIIVFGDVEPDSVSLDPRNIRVWEVAAPKIAAGLLRAIFIECSYDDSVDDALLYGHLCPRHLVAELTTLARKVIDCERRSASSSESASTKRKRASVTEIGEVSPKSKRGPSLHRETQTYDAKNEHATPDLYQDSRPQSCQDADLRDNNNKNNGSGSVYPPPLTGLSVYIIHVKGTLTDGPPPAGRILRELRAHGERAGLGCEFHIPAAGEGIWV